MKTEKLFVEKDNIAPQMLNKVKMENLSSLMRKLLSVTNISEIPIGTMLRVPLSFTLKLSLPPKEYMLYSPMSILLVLS